MSAVQPPRRRKDLDQSNSNTNGEGGHKDDHQMLAAEEEGRVLPGALPPPPSTVSSLPYTPLPPGVGPSPSPVVSAGSTSRALRQALPNYKVLLIGDSGVGKSNLLQRFANNTFDINARSTIGVEFVSREVDLSGGLGTDRVNVQLWDTAGQERCGLIASSFFRNARGVAVVYDMTRRPSLLNVPRWVAHAKQYADEQCVFTIIGNKTDLKNLIAVSDDDAEEISHSMGLRHYYASARTGDGVPDAFFQLILGVHSIAKVNAARALEAAQTSQSQSGSSHGGPGRGGANPTAGAGDRGRGDDGGSEFRRGPIRLGNAKVDTSGFGSTDSDNGYRRAGGSGKRCC